VKTSDLIRNLKLYITLDVYLVSNEKPAIISNGIGTSLFGVLESVDDDGYSVLRIGDSIISFFAHGSSFSIGSSIKIITDSISASPVSY